MRPRVLPLGMPPPTSNQVVPPSVEVKTPLPLAPFEFPTAAKRTAVAPVVVGSMTTSDQGSLLSLASFDVTLIHMAPRRRWSCKSP